jgi:hypothetical protein
MYQQASQCAGRVHGRLRGSIGAEHRRGNSLREYLDPHLERRMGRASMIGGDLALLAYLLDMTLREARDQHRNAEHKPEL